MAHVGRSSQQVADINAAELRVHPAECLSEECYRGPVARPAPFVDNEPGTKFAGSRYNASNAPVIGLVAGHKAAQRHPLPSLFPAQQRAPAADIEILRTIGAREEHVSGDINISVKATSCASLIVAAIDTGMVRVRAVADAPNAIARTLGIDGVVNPFACKRLQPHP